MIAHPIVADRLNDRRAEPRDIRLQNLKSLTVTVARNDRSPVLHELSQIARFSAWRCTRVEDFFSWFRIEKPTGEHGAWILNVAITRIESRCWQHGELYKVRIVRQQSRIRIPLQKDLWIDL